MESLRELYRIGPGPSSSHSLGIRNACAYYYDRYPHHSKYIAELYGSLSLTGKGHMTDKVIEDFFGADKVKVVFSHEKKEHPNTVVFYTADDGVKANEMTVYSVGGGAIEVKGEPSLVDDKVYPHNSLEEILGYCRRKAYSLANYVYEHEPDVKNYLVEIANQMIEVVNVGLSRTGYLPGKLHLKKIAGQLMNQAVASDDPIIKEKLTLSAYAYAAMEQSSSGEEVVTAPTLGSSGVLSALVCYYFDRGFDLEQLADGLAVAGVIGNIVKTNASISGATGGCQAEIGTACAMGAAFASYLEGLDSRKIEYAAEIAMEHHLGLTCDPVGGYVQIPCIERNGVATLRAIDAMNYAKYIGAIKNNKVSFDMVVEVMKYTGKRIPVELRETSLGGLAIELKTDE